MEHILEGVEDGRGRRPEILPRPGALVNSSTWAQLWGTRPRPPGSDGTPWGGETAARQGDPTAFLAGVSAPPPSPSAVLSDPTPALRCPSFQGASGFPERREGQRTRPLLRGSPNSSCVGGETPGRGPRGLRDYNSQRTPGREHPTRLWTPPETAVPAWAPWPGHRTRPNPPFLPTGIPRLRNSRGTI